jgi:hypothetical protein
MGSWTSVPSSRPRHKGVWEAGWSAQTVSRRARAERLTGWLGENRAATAGLAGRLPHSEPRGR